eukprot:gene15368-biopygen9711
MTSAGDTRARGVHVAGPGDRGCVLPPPRDTLLHHHPAVWWKRRTRSGRVRFFKIHRAGRRDASVCSNCIVRGASGARPRPFLPVQEEPPEGVA